jgi:O-acetyl-ADP-ribose deacetylase (regulator of RNase III)
MIREGLGNLLDAPTEAIVNTVNTVGVMGKGIALQFKQAFPANYKFYKAACTKNEVHVGHMLVFETGQLDGPRFIINFPTKEHWRGQSRLLYISEGLADLVKQIDSLGIRSIAVPALGCGNGGLDWAVVRPMIVEALRPLEQVDVHLYAPAGAPSASEMPVRTNKPAMTHGRAALILLLRGYSDKASQERFDAPGGASLLELQKLAYLLQASGTDLGLKFAKALYGPYAENLNHALQSIEGHYIRGYGDRSLRILDFHPIRLVDNAGNESDAWAEANDRKLPDSVRRTLQLIDGFASPYGLELLATVHWLACTSRERPTVSTLLPQIRKWNRRKARIFTEQHLRVALDRLQECDLLPHARPE